MSRPTKTRRRGAKGPTVDELVEHVDAMRATDAQYRRLNARVRRALRRFWRRLDDEARRAYLALEEAVNERDSHRLDSVAQFAFALGRRAATAAGPRLKARRSAVARLQRLGARETDPRR